jgi:hypothetical protein
MAIYACADVFTIPASLAGTQVKMLARAALRPPTCIFDVRNNNVSIGSITIQSSGTVVFAGTGMHHRRRRHHLGPRTVHRPVRNPELGHQYRRSSTKK